jgi:hypothetical protein
MLFILNSLLGQANVWRRGYEKMNWSFQGFRETAGKKMKKILKNVNFLMNFELTYMLA